MGNRKVTSSPLLLLCIKKDNMKESPTNRSTIKGLYIDLLGYYVIFFALEQKGCSGCIKTNPFSCCLVCKNLKAFHILSLYL